MKSDCGKWIPFSALALLLAGGAVQAATEIKGGDILAHPCGKVGVKQMSLLNQGKVEEANALSTPELRMQWDKASAADRKMMAGLAKEMSPTEAQFTADIKSHGVMTVDGNAATLKVEKKTTSASGSSTSTTTQRFKMEGSSCLVHR